MLALALIVGGSSHAVDWRSKYRNTYGTGCCGERDCAEITYQGFPKVGEILIGLSGPVTINVRYPSQDGRAYICNPGCFFYIIGT